MAVIGNSSTQQAFTPAVDYFSGNASTTAFTLSRPVASVAQVEAVIDNVVQNPSSAYTVSGNTITFTSAPLSGTNNIYVRYTSPITQVIAPGQGTVNTTALGNITNIASGNSSLTLQTGSSNTTAVTIDTSQQVGIGTTSPDSLLVVGAGTASTYTDVQIKGASTSNYGPYQAWLSGGTKILEISNYGRILGGTSTNSLITTVGALDMVFGTNRTERMRIDSSGNVGIGTSSPAARLTVVDSVDGGNSGTVRVGNDATYYGQQQFRYNSSEYRFGVYPSGNMTFYTKGSESARIDSAGRVQINTTNSGRFSVASIAGDSQCAYFYSATGVNNDVISCQNTATSGDNRFMAFYTEVSPTTRGNITYNRASNVVAYNTTSDQRLKENIVSAPSAFNKINSIKIRSFDWKENKSHTDFGVIAQELYLVAPEAVTKGVDKDDGSVDTHWAVDTSTLVPMLVKAVQELKALVDAQATEIAELKAKVGV